jgi:hypothetical protein
MKPRAGSSFSRPPSSSARLQIGGSGLAAARIGLHVERKLLALVEIAHTGALNSRDVNEHIRAATVLHDKAEAFLGVEELNGHAPCFVSRLFRFAEKTTA